jgi:dihydrofolate reductase
MPASRERPKRHVRPERRAHLLPEIQTVEVRGPVPLDMGAVRLFMSMSLDGFIADRSGDQMPLYPDLEKLRNTEALAEMIEATGAVVMGRRSYDLGDNEEGYVDYEHQVPIFVLTHRVPDVPAKHDPAKGLTFTFVTEGVESATAQAKAAAGDKDVQVIGGADVGQQLINARLLDQIQISLIPVLLGEGVRLFERIGSEQRELEKIKVIESPGRTDIRYRVVK